jgi:DNA processing protein
MSAAAPDTVAIVALLRLGRRPWSDYPALLEEAGSARTVLDRELAGEQSGQTSLLPIDPEPLLVQSAGEVQRWTSAGIRLLTVLDPAYPDNLHAAHDRPPLIFVAGELRPQDSRSVAVIGARQASPRGLAAARTIAERLAAENFTVISGLAAGIDSAAHNSTLDVDGRTVAVIGTGLNRVYPPQNAALQRRIAQRGAVISQFWPDAAPRRESFPLRNATMSGLALATIVVEAGPTSGARIQARQALAHGRPVFVTRSTLVQAWAQELAERPGVHVFDDPGEIITALERLQPTGTLTD